jgi:hypothetical protein
LFKINLQNSELKYSYEKNAFLKRLKITELNCQPALRLRSHIHHKYHALKLTGTKKADLARAIAVKPQLIQFMCNSKTLSSRFTFEIAMEPYFPNDAYLFIKKCFLENLSGHKFVFAYLAKFDTFIIRELIEHNSELFLKPTI